MALAFRQLNSIHEKGPKVVFSASEVHYVGFGQFFWKNLIKQIGIGHKHILRARHDVILLRICYIDFKKLRNVSRYLRCIKSVWIII